jgi:hypothetical protein
MYRLLVLVLCLGWSLLAHAGLFGPDFEITKTVPPKNGEDSVLYLTANGFTADEKYFVFGRRFEPRSAGPTTNGGLGSRHHLMRRNMQTGEEIEIAYSPEMGFRGGGAVVSGNTAFYFTRGKEPAIYAVDVPSSEAKLIWKLPKNERYGKWNIYPLSAELGGTRVLVSMADSPPKQTSEKLNDWQAGFMQTDAHSYLYLGVLSGGEWTFTQVFEQTTPKDGFVSHAQLNPVTGEDALIELDGIKRNNRAFIFNFKTQEMKPVRPEGGNGYMTHCNYVGDQLVQYMFYRGGPTDIGLANVKQGTYTEWEAGYHHHFAGFIAPDGTFYAVGDGHSGQWSPVVRYTVRNGKLVDSTTISSRGRNTAWEEYHGHPRFSPSGKYLVHTSSDRMEQGQVVIIKDPLKEK